MRAPPLDVAFDGVDTPIDLVRLSVDGLPPDYFAVMAGIGIDAVIMEGTDPKLKKAVGSAAYFLSAAQNANHPALHATIQVDDQPPLKRRAHVLVIGNVATLQANIQLIPGARPDDGLLDVLIASPRTVNDWLRLIARVLARRRRLDSQMDRLGRKEGHHHHRRSRPVPGGRRHRRRVQFSDRRSGRRRPHAAPAPLGSTADAGRVAGSGGFTPGTRGRTPPNDRRGTWG